MPEFLGPITLKDAYDPAIQIGPAKGVTQFSLSLFAQTTDPNNSYPAMVQFWRYPWDEVSGFNINGDPILESGERFFAGNTQGALYRGVAGAKLRNYVKGKNAVALAEIDFAGDPTGSGGTVSNAATTTGGTSGGGGTSFLGKFTLAQWPPSSPTEGNTALLYGVNDGSTFAWLDEYQPSVLGSTYPWGPPPGVTQPYSYKTSDSNPGAWLLTATGWVYTGAVGAAFTKNIPLAGVWNLAAQGGFYDQTAAADVVGVGVSSTSTVQPTAGNSNTAALDGNGRGSVEMLLGQLTIAANNTNVFGWLNSQGGAHVILVPSFTLGIAPVQHA